MMVFKYFKWWKEKSVNVLASSLFKVVFFMISKLFKRKPSKSEQSSLESGLYIENSIKVSYSKKRSLTNVVLLLVITLFGLFGSIFSFISIFNVGANYTQLVAFTLLFHDYSASR